MATEQQEEDMRVLLTAVNGKIDLLNEKLSNSHLLIEQRIDANAREQLQMVRLVEAQVKYADKRLDDADHRFENVVQEGRAELREAIDRLTGVVNSDRANRLQHEEEDDERFEKLDDRMKSQEIFRTQVKVVIALITLIVPILNALIIKWIGG